MKRLHCDKANWHVIVRGARRLELFRDDEDYLNFFAILEYALAASGCVLWAVAVMTNHFHLALQGSSEEQAACMHRLDYLYSYYHNRKYGLVGHAFDGPYKTYRHSSLLLLLRTIAYIFLNPVVAGNSATPEGYRWSSYRSFMGLPGAPIQTNPTALFTQIDPDPKAAWQRFSLAIEREAARAKRKEQRGLTMVEVHAQQFEWLLEEAQSRQNLPVGLDATLVALYWARQCGITPRAMVSVLKDWSPELIRKRLRRFAARLVENPEWSRLLTLP